MEARSLTSDEFREVISHFASGVTVITSRHDGRSFGTTASAVTSLSLEPPMLLICMNKQSETGRAVALSKRFGVNILGADQADLAERLLRRGATNSQASRSRQESGASRCSTMRSPRWSVGWQR